MPTQWEQEVAEIYVTEGTLNRPDINVVKVLLLFLAYLTTSVVFTLGSWVFIDWIGILDYFPSVSYYIYTYPERCFLWANGFVIFISSCFLVSPILIKLILLYQHYSPEIVRRRCLFMPTCSDYAILALRKYGAIKALPMIYDRLFKRCRGDVYQIDFP